MKNLLVLLFPQNFGCFNTIHNRHINVHQYNIDANIAIFELFELLNGLFSVLRLINFAFQRIRLKQGFQGNDIIVIIIDNEDFYRQKRIFFFITQTPYGAPLRSVGYQGMWWEALQNFILFHQIQFLKKFKVLLLNLKDFTFVFLHIKGAFIEAFLKLIEVSFARNGVFYWGVNINGKFEGRTLSHAAYYAESVFRA